MNPPARVLVPPSRTGIVQVRIAPDGSTVTWARNGRGFLSCTVTHPDHPQRNTGHVSAGRGVS